MPDWTDGSQHDPGITFVELFAWLAGALLFAVGLRAYLTRHRGRRPGKR